MVQTSASVFLPNHKLAIIAILFANYKIFYSEITMPRNGNIQNSSTIPPNFISPKQYAITGNMLKHFHGSLKCSSYHDFTVLLL